MEIKVVFIRCIQFSYKEDALVFTQVKKLFYHTDHLGSTTVMTNQSGGVVERTSYSPYGEILSGGDTARYDYEGKEYSEVTTDYDFHFRKYDPVTGRFSQPDAIIPNVYDPQSLNRYAFERNNPYKYVDENGKAFFVPLLVLAVTTAPIWAPALYQLALRDFINSADEFDKDPSLSNFFWLGVAGFDALDPLPEGFFAKKTVSLVEDAGKYTISNFRKNVLKETGESGIGNEAHHIFAKKFEDIFNSLGINIHDPKYGVMVEKILPRKTAYEYNKQIAGALEESISSGKEAVINSVKEVAKSFGFSPRF